MEKLPRYGKGLNLSAFVLDCSITISWFMPDESFDLNFLNQVSKEGAIVPSIWPLEIGNVLLLSERKMRITLEQRQKALHVLTELPIIVDTMTSHNAWLETMELADRHNLTLYDATYLELSLRRSLPLATSDKQLKKAAELSGIRVLPLK